MTLNERIKSNCLISRESCPHLELLRKGLGYSYHRRTLVEIESEMREPASDSHAEAETMGAK
jgi:hypothetical protein